MRKSIFALLPIGLVLVALVLGIRQFNKPDANDLLDRSASNQQINRPEFLEINEWGVKVPLSSFGNRPAQGYVIGNFTNDTTEAIVFIDTTVKTLAAVIGADNFEVLRRCASYTPSLSRNIVSQVPSADHLPAEMKLAPAKTLNGYEYRVITPQAVCPDVPKDYPNSVVGKHIIGTTTNTDSVQPADIAQSMLPL